MPCAKVLGAARGRRQAFRPDSLVNISAMSFGSLPGDVVAALAAEQRSPGACTPAATGAISRHHLHGGDLVLQVGLAESVGAPHPGLVTPDDLELLDGMRSAGLASQYAYEPGWRMPAAADRAAVAALMSATAPEGDSAPPSATAQT